MTPRVFIVNEPLRQEDGAWRPIINLDPARDFGPLIHMLPAGALPDDMTSVVETLKLKMHDFTQADYLLLIGDPRAMAVAAVLAARAGDGCFRMLRWQRRQRRYDCVEVADLFDAPRNAFDEVSCTHGQPMTSGCNPCQRSIGEFNKDDVAC